ncbi:hypothetical protein RHGRI_022685 [Rhododendron griersonianum]|uniref:MADS-box domain-containing protein n=1 Tax=Rhododendron griersonianum TaxID=479676 RepID=A0AAV6J3Z6_9ERIC|nr:hypothetical protein RHGRI_022685 [Rhododendron griersonianum]
METHKEKKTSMGRQRIEIKKIEKKSQLQVTFSKRRSGIFRKAGELSVLCGARVAVIVASPAGKIFAFGSPSVDAVVDRFLAGNTSWGDSDAEFDNDVHRLRDKHGKVVRELEVEEEREKAARGGGGGGSWWEQSLDGLGLSELEQYKASLEVLKSKVMRRADEMGQMATAEAEAAAGDLSLPGNFLIADHYFSGIEQNSSDFDNFDYN